MGILNEKEWEFLSEIIHHINNIEDLDKMRLYFLQKVKKLIDYDFADFSLGEVYNSTYLKLVQPVVVSNFSKSFEEEFMSKYESYYGEIDYVKWVFSNYESTVYRESDLINEDIRKKSPFYIDYLEPSGLIYLAGMSIIEDGVFTGAVTLYRTKIKGDFSDRDLYILNQLLIHLESRLKNIDKIDLYNHRDKKYLDQYRLTLREYEIIRLICKGYNNFEISQKASICVSTVKKHINNIFAKVGVKSRTQLIAMFLDKDHFNNI